MMTTNAVAVARADKRRKHIARIMASTSLSYACKLACINAMGKENRTL